MYSVGVSEEQQHRGKRRKGVGPEPAGTLRADRVKVTPVGVRRASPKRRSPRADSAIALPIMAVFVLLSGVAAALLTVHLHNDSIDPGAVAPFAPATRAIVINLDGADPALLKSVPMPNLKALQQNGVTYSGAWVGQMETTASASAASIGTGAFPRFHGVVADVWYDSASKKIVRVALPNEVLVGSIDAAMEPTGVASLASDLKSRRPSARVLSVAGTNCGTAAAVATWVADFIVCAQRGKKYWSPISVAGHELPISASRAFAVRTKTAPKSILTSEMQGWVPASQDHWIARETVAAMQATKPAVTFVSFPEIALVRRDVAPSRATAAERAILRGLDADIGRLVHETQREGNYRSTIFAVTAGRAFEPIRHRMLFRHLSSAIVAAGGESTYLAGDGAALIGLRDPLQAQPVAQALQSESSRFIDALYYKTQSGSAQYYNAQFLSPQVSPTFARASSYLLSTMAAATSPDVVVEYQPYAALAGAGARGAPAGGIGTQWPIQHVPLIVAGHGVYAGRTSNYPARLVDIAPTLETALGLGVTARNGTVLADALYGDTAATPAQKAERTKLAPLTAALRARLDTLPN